MAEAHIVNTASTAGLLPYGFDRMPYTATKHAIVGLTESLAHTHVVRVLAERAKLVPGRRRLAERAARTARLVAERNRRAIALDDGSVFERIAAWRSERN